MIHHAPLPHVQAREVTLLYCRLQCICQSFEPCSPAEGFQRAVLADITAAAGNLDVALAHAEMASDILQLHFGNTSSRRDEMQSLAAAAGRATVHADFVEEAQHRILAWAGG